MTRVLSREYDKLYDEFDEIPSRSEPRGGGREGGRESRSEKSEDFSAVASQATTGNDENKYARAEEAKYHPVAATTSLQIEET